MKLTHLLFFNNPNRHVLWFNLFGDGSHQIPVGSSVGKPGNWLHRLIPGRFEVGSPSRQLSRSPSLLEQKTTRRYELGICLNRELNSLAALVLNVPPRTHRSNKAEACMGMNTFQSFRAAACADQSRPHRAYDGVQRDTETLGAQSGIGQQ